MKTQLWLAVNGTVLLLLMTSQHVLVIAQDIRSTITNARSEESHQHDITQTQFDLRKELELLRFALDASQQREILLRAKILQLVTELETHLAAQQTEQPSVEATQALPVQPAVLPSLTTSKPVTAISPFKHGQLATWRLGCCGGSATLNFDTAKGSFWIHEHHRRGQVFNRPVVIMTQFPVRGRLVFQSSQYDLYDNSGNFQIFLKSGPR